MAKKPTSEAASDSGFAAFLADCPAAEADADADQVTVIGAVTRSKSADKFVLATADAQQHELPTDAVESFEEIQSAGPQRVARLSINTAKLDADVAGRLAGAGGAGGITNPALDHLTIKEVPKDPIVDTLKEQPWDTLKEQPADTLKEQPWDTLKEQNFDTLKEQDFDTLKEQNWDTLKEQGADTLVEQIPGIPEGGEPRMRAFAGGAGAAPAAAAVDPAAFTAATRKEIGKDPITDTIKEQPQDTLKEQPWDTLKEQPFDTLKEQNFDTLKEQNWDTLKEQNFDTLKEQGADTLVEQIPGLPEGQHQVRAFAAAPGAAPAAAAVDPAAFAAFTHKEIGKDPITDTLKEQPWDTLKEQNFDTLKELHFDTLKEQNFDTLKEQNYDTLWEAGGGTMVEQIPQTPGGWQQAQPAGGGAAPFVLATPHQAPAGAVAQQHLATQARLGQLGLL